MDSLDDGWAASSSAVTGTGYRALVLHYSGGRWQAVDVPALDAVLKGPPGTSGSFIQWISVQMFGPDAGWMFAWTNIPRDPNNPASRAEVVILRYEHGVWTPIAAPNVSITTELFGLSAVSADEAWIVGTDYGSDLKTLFAHYRDGAWSLWPQTFPGVAERFTMLSPSDGWAFDSGGGPTLLLHYDGTTWASVAMRDWTDQRIDLFPTVFSVSPGVLWFPAAQGYGDAAKSLFEQYSGGQWRQITWPFSDVHGYPLRLVSVSTGELWGIGTYNHQEGCPPLATTEVPQGVFLHYQQGTWTREVLP
jgi:hypothetical protein